MKKNHYFNTKYIMIGLRRSENSCRDNKNNIEIKFLTTRD